MMRPSYSLLLSVALFIASSLASSNAGADDENVIEAPATPSHAPAMETTTKSLVIEAPPEGGLSIKSTQLSFEGYDQDARYHHLRGPRIALYTSAGVAVLGLALVLAGDSQCDYQETRPGIETYECNRAGKALGGLGVSFAVASLVGIVISGGILLKRRKTLKKERESRAYGRIQWDIARSRATF